MTQRGKLPAGFFGDDTYTLTPQVKKTIPKKEDAWIPTDQEGQLSVDVFETVKDIVITAPIAGVKPENLEIYVSQDLVTIRGTRDDCHEEAGREYLYQECHWGRFSRSIILPVQVLSDKTEAILKNGVLTITLPKQEGRTYVPISEVKDE